MTNPALPYRTPEAFRSALTDKFRTQARKLTPSLQQMTRQFAYDRFLARIFLSSDRQAWVLKGGGALLARLAGARHSMDLDLYRAIDTIAEAEHALRQAARTDLGDFFTFELGRAAPLRDEQKGVRIPVLARIGRREFERFPVDVVAGLAMTGEPDETPPLLSMDINGLRQPHYRVYPLADHIADKVCAIYKTHSTSDGTLIASSRIKDFVDLAIIATTQSVDAASLRRALVSELARNHLAMPEHFAVPDEARWAPGYEHIANSTPALTAYRTYDQGRGLVAQLLDPILNNTAHSTWQPQNQTWVR